jgi:AAA15 family ATPase/GTPase
VHRSFDEQGNPTSLVSFDIDENESEGTRKLIYLAGPLIDTLKHGKVLFIDEFDARLHPLITHQIISLFNSNNTNPNNAQLIFATHDTNLLSNRLFRRDQIWFAEKDKLGATHFYSLVEYKVRNDASFEKDYIRGKYGAIPFIGDLAQLLGRDNGK